MFNISALRGKWKTRVFGNVSFGFFNVMFFVWDFLFVWHHLAWCDSNLPIPELLRAQTVCPVLGRNFLYCSFVKKCFTNCFEISSLDISLYAVGTPPSCAIAPVLGAWFWFFSLVLSFQFNAFLNLSFSGHFQCCHISC